MSSLRCVESAVAVVVLDKHGADVTRYGPITSRMQGHTLSVSFIHLKQHLHACKNEVCGHIAATKFPAVYMSFILDRGIGNGARLSSVF